MEYIWNQNNPIAIHITEGDYTPKQLQTIANHEYLVVRDLRLPPEDIPSTAWGTPSYYPVMSIQFDPPLS